MKIDVWENLFKASQKLITDFSTDENQLLKTIKNFCDNLVIFSDVYDSDRENFLAFFQKRYKVFWIQAVNILSNADSVSAIMNINQGENDYKILINLYRQLIVNLDALSSDYWLNIALKVDDAKFLKMAIKLANEAAFEQTKALPNFIKKTLKENNLKENDFFKTCMNKEMWNAIKDLGDKVLPTPDGDFEHFESLMKEIKDFSDDMIMNLWAILAVNICYLEFLTEIVGVK